MFLNKKAFVFLPIVLVFVLVCSFSAWGETAQPDELWAKAVELASRNQGLIPGKIYKLTKNRNFWGKVTSTEESWSDFVETEAGKIEVRETKKIVNEQEVVDAKNDETKKKKEKNYNSDLADFTMPFNSKIQQSITLKRLKRFETKDGQSCIAYNFKCITTKGNTIIGKAWLNEYGIPVAMNYRFDPLPQGISPQLYNVFHEVHYQYQPDGSWYPEKVRLKLKAKPLILNSVGWIEMTFSEYWKTKTLAIMTGGKLLNVQQLPGTVPFEYIDNHLYVKVSLNDSENDYRFMVDTGASATAINHRSASALGLLKKAEINNSDGYISKKVDLTVIKKISLGEVTVEDCGAMIFDFNNLETAGINIDGILGSNFLKLFTVRIDYLKRKLTFVRNIYYFIDQTARSYKIPLNQDSTGLIFTPFNIPGAKILFRAEIDSGSSSSLLIPNRYLEDFKPILNCPVVKTRGIYTRGAFGGSEGTLSRMSEFAIGDLHFQNQLAYFDNRKLDHLLIGNKFLSQFAVIIDYPTSRMFLLPLKEQTFDTNLKTYGFGVEKNANGESQVIMVWESSAADRGGLRVGDLILRAEAEGETGTSYEAIDKMMDKYDTLQLFVRRDAGEAELVLKKEWLLPEVN